MPDTSTSSHPFAFDDRYRAAGRVFGVRPDTTSVEVGERELVARFGPWQVRTAHSNVTGASLTGPYSLPRTIGPAHLSFQDRGLTFATNPDAGACIRFRRPVAGLEPLGWLRHPGLTVTVSDPEALVLELDQRRRALAAERQHDDPAATADLRVVQAAEDDLHLMSARELRALASERGLRHTSSMKKAELVQLLDADLGVDLAGVLDDREE